jgi:hypothetical protein
MDIVIEWDREVLNTLMIPSPMVFLSNPLFSSLCCKNAGLSYEHAIERIIGRANGNRLPGQGREDPSECRNNSFYSREAMSLIMLLKDSQSDAIHCNDHLNRMDYALQSTNMLRPSLELALWVCMAFNPKYPAVSQSERLSFLSGESRKVNALSFRIGKRS